MAETFCGKSCANCTYQEELNCPGCGDGPGHKYRGDCRLKKCCMDKSHETCATCQLNPHCGTYRDREQMPRQRIEARQREEARHQEALRRSPLFGRWLTVLFWLQIPQIIVGLMTNENVVETFPALQLPGTILRAALLVATVLILFRLSREEDRYRIAAWCILVSGGLNLVTSLSPRLSSGGAHLLLAIPAGIVGLVGIYHEYHAHSACLDGIDASLGDDWERLWKLYIGIEIGALACLVLVIIPVLAVIGLLVVAVGAIVAGIWEMILLYNSARAFREFR